MGTLLPSSRNTYAPQNGQSLPAEYASSPFHCTLCSRDFAHETALQNHLITSQSHRKTKIRTTQLNSKLIGLNRHSETETNSRVGCQRNVRPAAYCSVCNRDFVTEGALIMHVEYSETHQSRQDAIAKDIVAKNTQEAVVFRNGVPNKSPHCSICNRGFVDGEALAMHIKHSETHRNQNNAPARVIAKVGLETAPRNNIPAKSFHCSICNRTFVNGQALAMHVKHSTDHHKRNTATVKDVANGGEKAVACRNGIHPKAAAHCSVCNRDFVNGEALTMHIERSKDHQKKNTTARPSAMDGQATAAPRNDVLPRIIIPPPPTSTLRVIEAATTGSFQEQPIHILGHSQPNGDFSEDGVPLQTGSPWSKIPQQEWLGTLEALSRKCHSLETLSKNGYRVRECTQAEMDELRKCRNCGGQQKKIESYAPADCVFHPRKPNQVQLNLNGNVSNDEPIVYPCCGDIGRGCTVNLKHEYAPLEHFTRFRLSSYARAPTYAQVKAGKRSAIALDCEMAGVIGGSGEVVRLCAVDYIAGEVLIDSLVVPAEKIIQWRTKYSGVSPAMLAGARARGEALWGWQGARAELWKYMDADTILIGQSLHNDLSALRMVHTCVVDSAILAKNAVDPDCPRSWSLKTLSNALLGLKIQTGKSGHDCMEDTLATREVVLECNRNPQKLKAWADNERKLILEEKEKREQEKREREEQRKENGKEKFKGNGGQPAYIENNDQSDLLLTM